MDYNGFRFNNLYKEAERDVIDDLKDEVVCLKKKIKHCKYREEDLEEEISNLSQKKHKLENDIERIMNESTKMKRNLEDQRIKEEDINFRHKELDQKVKDILNELKAGWDIYREGWKILSTKD